ncbi:thermonuclease family protein [Aquisphaera insulae]|uniref:thermonuclease family protein n=1 Tax=Aquisphaera insulae TaxID=2712864 RepID=UPI0013EAB028|nr:thermonuclease family protein [Aquisphaera insulae]
MSLRASASIAATSACLCIGLAMAASHPSSAQEPPRVQGKVEQKPQTRPHGAPVVVDPATIRIDDGDTVVIKWGENDEETVRILGIDTPETRHEEHSIPYDQPFGPEGRAFARGAFSVASDVKLIRAAMLDPYQRTLGYLILDGKNYSVLVIKAGLSDETVSFYGDNGLPALAAEVTAAAKGHPPLAFEPPHVFRKRMRAVVDAQKSGQGAAEK